MRWPLVLRRELDRLARSLAESEDRAFRHYRHAREERTRADRLLALAEAVVGNAQDPVALGAIFSTWGSVEQAAFFDGLAAGPETWKLRPGETAASYMQWFYVGKELSGRAREVLAEILAAPSKEVPR